MNNIISNSDLIENIINDFSYLSLLDEETKNQIKFAMIDYAKIKTKEQLKNCAAAIQQKEDTYLLNNEYCYIINNSQLPDFSLEKEKEVLVNIKPVLKIKTFYTKKGLYILLLLDPLITSWELKISNNNDYTILFYVDKQKKPLLYLINNCREYEILGNPFSLSEYESKKIVDYIDVGNEIYYKDYIDGTYEILHANNSFNTLLSHLNIYEVNVYENTDMKYKNPAKYKIVEENSGNWLLLKKLK